MPVGDDKWIISCIRFGGDIYLLTYGYPPNSASQPRPARSKLQLSVYPNPFGSTLQLSLPGLREETVILYDILGRTVWSQRVTAGVRNLTISDPRLGQLAFGTYFLQTRGAHLSQPVQIIHLK
jgi:hypothetical protein